MVDNRVTSESLPAMNAAGDEEEKGPRRVFEPLTAQLGEDSHERAVVMDFLLDIIKAMLRTGYYDPEHPEAQRASEGLYEEFQEILQGRIELSFITTFQRDNPDLLVDGPFPDPIYLSSLLTSSMGELFIPKFIEVFHRKNMISISIKVAIGQEEFEEFIRVMGATAPVEEVGTDSEEEEWMARKLDELRIHNVSCIFDRELVGRDSRMNWRVKLALSRIKKDLRLLPMFKHASDEEIRGVKRQIFEDIVRPIRYPDVIKEILANLHLIRFEVDELSDLDLESEVLENMPMDLLAPTVDLMVDDYEKLPAGDDRRSRRLYQERQSNLGRLLRKGASRMLKEDYEEGNDCLLRMFEMRLLGFKELSGSVKDRVITKKLVDSFMGDEERFLAKFEAAQNIGEYADGLLVVNRVILWLLEQGNLSKVRSLLDVLDRHRRQSGPFEERGRAADRAIQEFCSHALVDRFRKRFVMASRDERRSLVSIFGVIGASTLPILLDMLKVGEDPVIRKETLAAIERIGEPAIPALVEELEAEDNEWYVISNILHCLAQIGSPEAYPHVEGFIQDPHFRLREAALSAAAKLMGLECEGEFIKALKDDNNVVRRRAVSCLGAIKTRSGAALGLLRDILAKRKRKDDEESDEIQMEAVFALVEIGNVRLPGGELTIEEHLCSALQRERRGLFGLDSPYRNKSENVRRAICDALGAIGTSATCSQVLTAVSKENESRVRDSAKDALRRIRVREEDGSSGSAAD